MEMIGGGEVNHRISTWFINWGRVGVLSAVAACMFGKCFFLGNGCLTLNGS